MLRQETETVIEQYLANRTPENRERLVLQSVPLVHYILGRLGITRDMGSEYEDLVHQGTVDFQPFMGIVGLEVEHLPFA